MCHLVQRSGQEVCFWRLGFFFFFFWQAGDWRLKSKGQRPGRFVCVNYRDLTGRQGDREHCTSADCLSWSLWHIIYYLNSVATSDWNILLKLCSTDHTVTFCSILMEVYLQQFHRRTKNCYRGQRSWPSVYLFKVQAKHYLRDACGLWKK